jgi:hypothetical protein
VAAAQSAVVPDVPAVKRPVHLERHVDVHGTGKKRKQTQRETHDEAAKVQV